MVHKAATSRAPASINIQPRSSPVEPKPLLIPNPLYSKNRLVVTLSEPSIFHVEAGLGLSGKRSRKAESSQKRYYGNEDFLISERVYKVAEEMAQRRGRPVEELIADAVRDFLAKFGISF